MHISKAVRPLLILLTSLWLLSGCASLTSTATSRLAGNLSDAILDQDDPATVREALPSYLVMVDGLIANDPRNPKLLASGAQLYSAYASWFVTKPERLQRLTARGKDYGQRALCAVDETVCRALNGRTDQFVAAVDKLDKDQVPAAYAAAVAWAAWLQARRGDWNAIADLPKITALFRRVVILEPGYDQGGAYQYLGIIDSLLPPAMGGQPAVAKQDFEQAVAFSKGRNLMAKVMYARYYAPLVQDKALYEKLLHEVLAATPQAPGFTLTNVMAQQQATQLLKDVDRHF
ncbi:MAG: TRAP transporter TatT component family protein [Gammaproteobacteria bacterium]|jgi:hypothetical protein